MKKINFEYQEYEFISNFLFALTCLSIAIPTFLAIAVKYDFSRNVSPHLINLTLVSFAGGSIVFFIFNLFLRFQRRIFDKYFLLNLIFTLCNIILIWLVVTSVQYID